MAESHYSADSAPLPQPCLPSDVGKTLDVTAWFPRKPVLATAVFLLTDTGAYIGESDNLGSRLPDHDAVRRKSDQSGILTPISID